MSDSVPDPVPFTTARFVGIFLAILLILAAIVLFYARTRSDPAATNAAIDTARYIESGISCEPSLVTSTYQAARCTLPDRSKIYCAAGPEVRGPKGDSIGFTCVPIAGAPAPAPSAPAPASPAPAPASPASSSSTTPTSKK